MRDAGADSTQRRAPAKLTWRPTAVPTLNSLVEIGLRCRHRSSAPGSAIDQNLVGAGGADPDAENVPDKLGRVARRELENDGGRRLRARADLHDDGLRKTRSLERSGEPRLQWSDQENETTCGENGVHGGMAVSPAGCDESAVRRRVRCRCPTLSPRWSCQMRRGVSPARSAASSIWIVVWSSLKSTRRAV